MADKPGKYWDHIECRWVKYTTAAEQPSVPQQPEPVETPTSLERAPEVDVRSR